MKRMLFAGAAALLVAVAALMGSVVTGFAAENAEEPLKVILTGENKSLIAMLAPNETERADEAYAKLNAFVVTQAEDEFGMMMTEMEGFTLHYLPNKTGQELMVGEALTGKTVKVTGLLFKKAATLQVLSYEEVDTSDDFSWDEPAVGTKSKKKVF